MEKARFVSARAEPGTERRCAAVINGLYFPKPAQVLLWKPCRRGADVRGAGALPPRGVSRHDATLLGKRGTMRRPVVSSVIKLENVTSEAWRGADFGGLELHAFCESSITGGLQSEGGR
ncbi:hypothetical protein SKAU_G00058080 [Synaphobranchus kaupii]|uniref:Uncharacterized protein n=1 Tax=Synaphobranchus kaupii TaxID=118154 RepID=A0A9Q1JA37_SYNKA|nr:hypothetical protein SKAU_G00058080 [Synaphobranchus kaupii]